MVPFSEYVIIDNKRIELKFIKIETTHQQKFSITVIDSEKTHNSFLMARDSYGSWNLLQPIPKAILNIKHLIIEMINTHSQN
jgi:hypothetical protein